MRPLTSVLLAAQQAATGRPFLSFTIDGADYSGRLLDVKHVEKPFGGVGTFILTNYDKALSGTDFRGKKVIAGYGYYCDSAPQYSQTPPLWVLGQEDVSYEGEVAVQLDCIDLWHKLGLDTLLSGGVDLKGTITGYFQPGMWVTGQTSGARARVAYTGTGYIAVTHFITVQNFSAGETVKADADATVYIVTNAVSSWAGGPGPGWNGTTILDIIKQLLSGLANVVLDSSDGVIDSTKPFYFIQTGATTLQVVQDLLGRTKCGARVDEVGQLRIFSVASDPSPVYTYYRGTNHVHFRNIRDRRLVLPNRVTVYNSQQQATGTTAITGQAEDVAAKNQYGDWVDRFIDVEAQSNVEATQIAQGLIRKAQMEATIGTIEAPMNCGQELLDYIRGEDDRSNVIFQAWVGAITRTWKPGQYRIEIGLGGLTQAEMLPMPDMPMPNFPTPDVLPIAIPSKAPRAIGQGEKIALIDIVFYPDTWESFHWDAGYIRFVDGTSQYIQAGSRTMANPVEYLYAVSGVSTLMVTADLGSTQNWNQILVAQCSRGVGGVDKVMIIPIRGKAYWTLDSIFDGTGYGRVKKYSLSSDGLVLLDQVREGTLYGRVKKASLTADGLVVMDAVVDGTYARVKKSALDASGLVVMDQVIDGTFAKVRATAVQAGMIKLWETVEGADVVKVSSAQRTGAARAYDFLEAKLTAYGLSLASSATWTRVELTAAGLRGLYQGGLQFELRTLDGRAYCGGGAVVLDSSGIRTSTVRIDNAGLWVAGGKAIRLGSSLGMEEGYIAESGSTLWINSRDIKLVGSGRVYTTMPLDTTGYDIWAGSVHLTGSLNANGDLAANNLDVNNNVMSWDAHFYNLYYNEGGWYNVRDRINEIYNHIWTLYSYAHTH